MQRNDENRDAELIDLGSIGDTTKGLAPFQVNDSQGIQTGGGLSDD